MPETTHENDAVTWHEPGSDVATPPYDSAEVAAIVEAWTPRDPS